MKDMIDTQGKPSPRRVGVNNASLFPGFCNKHDTALFKPIEGETVSLNKDTAFLFSYRAIAYERFAKEAQLKGISVQRDLDRGLPFLQQRLIQTHLKNFQNGVKIGMRDVDRWKKQFDERLLSGARDDFHFLAVRFDRVLPIVACGAFHPEYDVQGKPLQRLGRTGEDYDHVTVNVTSLNGQTISVLAGLVAKLDRLARLRVRLRELLTVERLMCYSGCCSSIPTTCSCVQVGGTLCKRLAALHSPN